MDISSIQDWIKLDWIKIKKKINFNFKKIKTKFL